MNFSTHIQGLPTLLKGDGAPTRIIFQAAAYSPLFFMFLYQYLQRSEVNNLTTLDERVSLDDFKQLTTISFLGSKNIFYLKDLSWIDTRQRAAWYDYVFNYKGPHTLVVSTSATEKQKESTDSFVIQVPDTLTREQYQQFFALFFTFCQPDVAFDQRLFRLKSSVDIDMACRFMRYQTVVGKNSSLFFDFWLVKIAAPTASLFTLSQYLFAGEAQKFYDYWLGIKDDYPEEFWTVFWSEQIWQAAIFVYKTQHIGYAEAKKSFTRLPFSFIQKDWKKHTISSLTQAHDLIYQLDYRNKTGIEGWYGLDLMFNKYFLSNH